MSPKTPRKKQAIKTPEHLAHRVKLLRQRLRADGLDGLLVTNARDIRYLTGFIGDDSWLYVPAGSGKVAVISDLRFKSHIPEEAPHVRVVMRGTKNSRRESLADAVARFLPSSVQRVGLQTQYMLVPTRKQLVKALGAKRIKDYDDGLLKQRSIKDDREVRLLRKAVKIQQQAFLETREFLEVGMTENEVCAYLEYRMRALGADGPGFSTIVAFDDHASHSHAIPGSRKVKKNSSILIDWGARYAGYRSDMTRVINMGKPRKHIAEIYKVVEEAMLAAIDLVAPGVALKELDDCARGILKKHGHTLDHGLGHGIGLDVHETPSIGQSDTVLEPGQVITIEPGIYLGPKGGVRLEDDILVTEKGHRNLCDLPTSLEWSII
ncbi:MAG: Xaa-Pro peptidase family protein [Planctomycetota bacterium]